jgi:hypothetical protein
MPRDYAGRPPSGFSDGVLCDNVSTYRGRRGPKTRPHVTIRLHNGTAREHVARALSTIERPMNDRDLEDKFRSLDDGVPNAAASTFRFELRQCVAAIADAGELARASVRH